MKEEEEQILYLEETRPIAETLVFCSLKYIFFSFRILAIVYFTIQFLKYKKLQGQKRDSFTIYSLLYIAIASFLFAIDGLSKISYILIDALAEEKDSS